MLSLTLLLHIFIGSTLAGIGVIAEAAVGSVGQNSIH